MHPHHAAALKKQIEGWASEWGWSKIVISARSGAVAVGGRRGGETCRKVRLATDFTAEDFEAEEDSSAGLAALRDWDSLPIFRYDLLTPLPVRLATAFLTPEDMLGDLISWSVEHEYELAPTVWDFHVGAVKISFHFTTNGEWSSYYAVYSKLLVGVTLKACCEGPIPEFTSETCLSCGERLECDVFTADLVAGEGTSHAQEALALSAGPDPLTGFLEAERLIEEARLR